MRPGTSVDAVALRVSLMKHGSQLQYFYRSATMIEALQETKHAKVTPAIPPLLVEHSLVMNRGHVC